MREKRISCWGIFRFVLICCIFVFGFGRVASAKENTENEKCVQLLEKIDKDELTTLEGMGITQEQFKEITDFTGELTSNKYKDYDKARTVFDWICKNVKYENANNDPYAVFINKKGICQGYANLFRTMMCALKIPCVTVNGFISAGGHAWNLAYLNNEWSLIDATNGLWDSNKWSEFQPYFMTHAVLSEGDFEIAYYKGIAVSGYRGNEISIHLPDTVQGMEVTSISNRWSLPTGIQEITIPVNIRNIEGNFGDFEKLERIIVEEGNSTFSSFNGVLYDKEFNRVIEVPVGVLKLELKPLDNLEKNILYGLDKLEELRIGEGTKKLNGYAVENCQSLKKVLIPDSVVEIADEAFYDCSSFIVYANENSAGAEFAKRMQYDCKNPSLYEEEPEETEPPETEPEETENEIKPTESETIDSGSQEMVQPNQPLEEGTGLALIKKRGYLKSGRVRVSLNKKLTAAAAQKAEKGKKNLAFIFYADIKKEKRIHELVFKLSKEALQNMLNSKALYLECRTGNTSCKIYRKDLERLLNKGGDSYLICFRRCTMLKGKAKKLIKEGAAYQFSISYKNPKKTKNNKSYVKYKTIKEPVEIAFRIKKAKTNKQNIVRIYENGKVKKLKQVRYKKKEKKLIFKTKRLNRIYGVI